MINLVMYVVENVVGNGDNGVQKVFGLGLDGEVYLLELVFNNVVGFVDLLIGSGFYYIFISGIYLLFVMVNGVSIVVVGGIIVGFGGDINMMNVIGGIIGSSIVLVVVVIQLFNFSIVDFIGMLLVFGFVDGQYLLQVMIINILNVGSVVGGGCIFDGGMIFVFCVNV